MLRLGATLLSPLRTRFDDLKPTSPKPNSTPLYSSFGPPDEAYDIEPAEDVSRHARIEVMKRATENLKEAAEGEERLQLLNDVKLIMSEDAVTKDVFREMDGFLVLISILSSFRPQAGASLDTVAQNDSNFHLIFSILAQAVHAHPENRQSFETLIGHQGLHSTLEALIVSNSSSAAHIFDCLLAFSLNDFTPLGLFTGIDSANTTDENAIDTLIANVDIRLSMLHNPIGIVCIIQLLRLVTIPVSYAALKMVDRVAFASHRNQALLSQSGLSAVLLDVLRSVTLPESQLNVIQKTLKRLLEMGAPTEDARALFRLAMKAAEGEPCTQTLDSHIMNRLRDGMKTAGKWPNFISIGSGDTARAGLELAAAQLQGKTFPGTSGLTYLAWVYVERLPSDGIEHYLLKAEGGLPSKTLCTIRLLPSGHLSYTTPSVRDPIVLKPPVTSKESYLSFPLRRWVHIALIHHSSRSANNVRLFIDGILLSTHHSPYPKSSPPPISFFIGNEPRSSKSPSVSLSATNRLNDLFAPQGSNSARHPEQFPSAKGTSPRQHPSSIWFLASAHLLLHSLPNSAPRLIHTLGHRYIGNFQDSLARFLTYKACTSLNVAISQKTIPSQDDVAMLTQALRSGIDVKESRMAFSFNSAATIQDPDRPGVVRLSNIARDEEGAECAGMVGEVRVMTLKSLDSAIWNVGGAPVLLRLVELANTERDLVSALLILSEAINTSWRISEDMERIHGYLSLIAILRAKVHLVNLEVFHVLLEFLGMDFAAPENSTIINPIAYRAIALDFSFWSLLPPPLQRLHLSHFETILQTSRYRTFNAKFRFVKFGAVKKIIYVLQTHMYRDEMIPEVISALSCIARQSFSTEATIKPLISYLAANLEPHDLISAAVMSPSSPVSPVEKSDGQERAEQVLEAFVRILGSDAHTKKFKSAMPAPRICLLLLGNHPNPVIASHILNLCGLLLEGDPSFARKFEIVSFWSALQDVLPPAWDPSVHVAAFDVLFGRSSGQTPSMLSMVPTVACPNILPAILSALDYGLKRMVGTTAPASSLSADSASSPTLTSDSYTEVLAEELIELHSISSSFRSVFQSKPITNLFINACRSFFIKLAEADQLRARTVRVSEKLTHLALMLALDNAVDQHQKEELMEIMRISQHEAVTTISLVDQRPSGSTLSRSLSMRGSLRVDIAPGVDRALRRTLDRTNAWHQLIVTAERKRLRKAHQDHREYIRQMQRPGEWHDQLHCENGLWPMRMDLPQWRLDETEGPTRIRKKLQPELSQYYIGSDTRVRGAQGISTPDGDHQSVAQAEVPPWEDAYEFGSTSLEDDFRWGEDTADDRNRRVRHELEPGDVIEDLQTVTRIVGVDASPGLFIVGRSHIYMLDGLVQDEEGDIIDARDAPKNILSVPGTTLELDGKQCAQRWAIEQVAAFSKRTYLFRDVGLEIYFKDSRSILIVFSHKKDRQSIIARLHVIKMQGLDDMSGHGTMRTPLITRVSARVSIALQGGDEIMSAQRRWQAREISNYTYLSLINQASGRTPNDLTQYPVFPWVLKDYSSSRLDFEAPNTYRDLTKPIGALSPVKREAAETRYMNLLQVEEPPFHYGTHFSSSMIVTHFLIRLSPFSHYFKVLQGGDWDLPDRLFSDVKRAWDSASSDSPADVRELIPEWFTCPEFLQNLSRLDFGIQTTSSQKIDSVGLPPWAKQDPYLFIELHRKALESEYVSEHLPAWIDLVWGCKQRDKDEVNVFHPLSYEGAIDLDSISDSLEKEATAGIIHNFGQTPRKLFTAPHPARYLDGPMALPLGVHFGVPEDAHLLLQSSKPVRVLQTGISHLAVDPVTDRIVATSKRKRCVPQLAHEHVEWGFADKSLRLYADNKLTHVVEATPVICCDFPDSDVLVAGLEDTTVCIWQLSRTEGLSLRLLHVMRGHNLPPTCIASSRAWSLVVTGSPDRSAVLWDLNRGRYVRSVGTHDGPVTACAIQESSGCVATCSRDRLQVHTVNAHLIASLDLTSHEMVRSLAFHEREWSPVPVLAAGCSDGSIVLRTWNADTTPVGEKARWEFVTLRVLRCRKENNGEVPAVDALRFSSESLYHGDENGNVYLWSLQDH